MTRLRLWTYYVQLVGNSRQWWAKCPASIWRNSLGCGTTSLHCFKLRHFFAVKSSQILKLSSASEKCSHCFRGRGSASSRFDPYSAPSASSWVPRSEVYPSVPLHAADGYHQAPYRSGTLLAPPPSRAAVAAPGSTDDSFARELLQLYTKDPAAFDAYARNPEVRRSLNMAPELAPPRPRADPYLKTPREYIMEQRLQYR